MFLQPFRLPWDVKTTFFHAVATKSHGHKLASLPSHYSPLLCFPGDYRMRHGISIYSTLFPVLPWSCWMDQDRSCPSKDRLPTYLSSLSPASPPPCSFKSFCLWTAAQDAIPAWDYTPSSLAESIREGQYHLFYVEEEDATTSQHNRQPSSTLPQPLFYFGMNEEQCWEDPGSGFGSGSRLLRVWATMCLAQCFKVALYDFLLSHRRNSYLGSKVH